MGPNVYLLRLLLDRTCVKSLPLLVFYILSLFSLFSPCRDTCTHVKSIISIKALLPKKKKEQGYHLSSWAKFVFLFKVHMECVRNFRKSTNFDRHISRKIRRLTKQKKKHSFFQFDFCLTAMAQRPSSNIRKNLAQKNVECLNRR